jgi:fructose-1,6-bisphosphatase I
MDTRPKFITLERFILEQEEKYSSANGGFTSVLHGLTLATKLIWCKVSKAGLVNILGTTEQTNFTGDILKKIDLFAD